MTSITAVDLFCGCGGLSCGLERAGYRVLAGVDSEELFLRTYRSNFPDAKAIRADLSTADPSALLASIGLEPGQLSLVAGGPPCQGFSKNVPRRDRQADDPRNQLVAAFLRFVHAAMPRAVLMENVAEMKNGFDRSYTELIEAELGGMGYFVSHGVLRATDFGVPQRRRRAFFIAIRDRKPALPEPAEVAPVSVWDAIGDLPQIEHGEGLDPAEYSADPDHPFQRWAREGSRDIRNHVARRLRPRQLERLAAIGPGQSMKDLPERLRARSGYSGAYGRLSPDMQAPTITRWVFHPGSGRFGHPVSPRVITIREAARLQAFPDTFHFTGTYIQQSHQVGNAVPPLLAEALGRALLAG